MDLFDLVARIVLNTDDFDNGLDRARNAAGGFGDTLKTGLSTAAKVGAAAIGAATTAAAAFSTAAINTGKSFDSSMSQVAATMGYSVSELNDKTSEASQVFETLRGFAMEMGANTAFSATQAADALNYMALAGYDADKSMSMLPNVLNLAAAGGIELASASDMVTDAQSALGLSMDETQRLVDQMATASSKSNTSVAQLGDAILTVGGTAKNLAGGTTELNTALGILADNGIKGAEGGTALRNIILSLGAPTDKAAAALNALGVEVYDADGKMRPLNETFGDLNAVLSTMTQGEQTQVLNSIFNKVDLKSVNALLANSGERFDELSGYIDKAKDSAEAMAAVQLDNLEGDITLFSSAMEGAQIILSDQLTPSLREFVQFGTEAVSTLSTAFQEGGLSGAMDALGTILSEGLNMIIEQLPQFIDAGMQLLGALGEGLLSNLPVLTSAAVEIIVMLSKGIIDALPGLLDAAVQIMIALGEGIVAALPELIPKIPEIITSIVEILIQNIPKIMEVGVQIVAGLALGLIKAIPELIAAIPRLVAALIDGFCSLLGIHSPSTVFEGFGGNIVEGLLNGLSDAWDSIVSFFEEVVGNLIEFFSETWTAIQENAAAAWDLIVEVFSGAWDAVVSVWEAATGFFEEIGNGISALFETAMGAVSGFFESAWSLIQGIWNGAITFFSGIGGSIQSGFETVTSAVSSFFERAWDAVKKAWDAATEFFEGIWDGITGIFEGVADWFGGLFSDAWEAVSGAWSGVQEFFSGVWDKITGVFSDTLSHFKNIGKYMMEGIWNGIGDKIEWLKSKVGGVVNTIKSWFTGKKGFDEHSPSKWSRQVFRYILEGGSQGLKDGMSGLMRSVDSVTGGVKNGLELDAVRIDVDASSNSWGNIGEYFAGVWEEIQAPFEQVIEFFDGKFSGAASAVKTAWGKLGTFFAETLDGIKMSYQGISAYFSELFTGARDAVQLTWSTVQEFFASVWLGIQETFSPTVEFFSSTFIAAWEAVQIVWNAAQEFFGTLWLSIQEIFTPTAEFFGMVFTQAWEAVQVAWEPSIEYFSYIGTSIQEVFDSLCTTLAELFASAWREIQKSWDTATDYFERIGNGILEIYEGVAEELPTFFQEALDEIKTIWDGIGEYFLEVWENIKSAFSETVTFFRSTFQEAFDAVKSSWDGAGDYFKGVAEQIYASFEDTPAKFEKIGSSIVDAIKEGIESSWSALESAINQKVQETVEAASKKIQAQTENLSEKELLKSTNKKIQDKQKGLEAKTEPVKNITSVSNIQTATKNITSKGKTSGNGDIYNFYSPKALDPVSAAREVKKVKQELVLGYVGGLTL